MPPPIDPLHALRLYPLRAPVVVGRDDTGFINDNWLVDDGAGGRRYVLRAYRRVRDPERVAFQLAFQDHLLSHDFPTAAVVRARDGALFVTLDGVAWALFAFVEGEPFDFGSLAQAREAGRRLAEFEATAAGYPGPVVPPPEGEVDFGKWLAPVSSHVWRASVLAPEQEERLRELFAGGEFADELDYFRRWRRVAASEWPPERLMALPQSWLHCDYHGRNMVFRGDEMTGLFDFDFVTQGPRTFDVSRGVFNFGRERRGSTALREEFCHAFLDGFEASQPLSDEERDSLPFMAVLNWTPDAAFYAARRQESGDGDAGMGERLRLDVRMMRAMEAKMRRLGPR